MTSDSGLTSQDTDYAKHIQEVLDELRQLQQTPRLVTSPDELEALEREFVDTVVDDVIIDILTALKDGDSCCP